MPLPAGPPPYLPLARHDFEQGDAEYSPRPCYMQSPDQFKDSKPPRIFAAKEPRHRTNKAPHLAPLLPPLCLHPRPHPALARQMPVPVPLTLTITLALALALTLALAGAMAVDVALTLAVAVTWIPCRPWA